jgi:Uma2 family endonuclease
MAAIRIRLPYQKTAGTFPELCILRVDAFSAPGRYGRLALVNEHVPLDTLPRPVKLAAGDFRLLKQAGTPAGQALQDDDAESPIKLRIEDYLYLHEAGALERYGKTELVDGVVYAMNPQYRPHGFARDELAHRLRHALEAIGSSLHAAMEQSVSLPPDGEPQPDIIVTSEPRGQGAIPGASVALIVEIATSTPKWDLGEMLRLYAAAGIGEYWVIDLKAGLIHQLWSPQGNAYAERGEVRIGESITAVTIVGLTVETAGIS